MRRRGSAASARALDAILQPDTAVALAIIIALGCLCVHGHLRDAQVHDGGHNGALKGGRRCGAGPCKNGFCGILMDLRSRVDASGGTLTSRRSHWPSHVLSSKYVRRELASPCPRANLVF